MYATGARTMVAAPTTTTTLRDLVSFVVDAENAQEEAGEDSLNAERQQDGGGDHLPHRDRRVEGAEAGRAPAQHRDHGADHSGEERQPPDHQAGLELDVAEPGGVGRVGGMKPLLHGEHLGEDREYDQLVTDEACEAGEQQRVDVERDWSD